jgi:rhodanese-related sulfurtransferase
MDIFSMFNPNACSIGGRDGAVSWNWEQYFENKKTLESEGKKVILVDMINHPVEGSVPISNEIFDTSVNPEGTYFVLYCHSGGSSGALQKQLTPQLPEYVFVNLVGGIGMYPK